MQAQAVYHDERTVSIKFPFDQELVEALKLRIPAMYRTYNPTTKIWTIHSPLPTWAKIAVDLLLRRFPGADVFADAEATSSPQPTPIRRHDPDFAELHLLPTAPAELVAAAYRLLAKAHHPDRGGDTRTMQALNAAYERLQARGVA